MSNIDRAQDTHVVRHRTFLWFQHQHLRTRQDSWRLDQIHQKPQENVKVVRTVRQSHIHIKSARKRRFEGWPDIGSVTVSLFVLYLLLL